MALRLLEVVCPSKIAARVREVLAEPPVYQVWEDPIAEQATLVRALLSAEHAESVCDRLEGVLAGQEAARMILLPVEAALPRPEPSEEKSAATTTANERRSTSPARIGREELYDDVGQAVGVTMVYLVMVVLSALVAAIGLLRDNVAILIGAMVIAPLLGPNVALSLATTLGDSALARRAVTVAALGVALAAGLAAALGAVLPVDPGIAEIAARTEVGIGDIAIALAAGIAGALAFTTGVPTALIGVMVAVALLPPLVAFGLLLGSGHWQPSVGAALLFCINVVCVNLAGVATFVAQGIRPRTWWEASRAKRASRAAIAAWLALLLLLAALIVIAGQRAA